MTTFSGGTSLGHSAPRDKIVMDHDQDVLAALDLQTVSVTEPAE